VKRALLTGGTGFVGANLARRLLDLGHEVHLLVRPRRRSWRLAGLEDRVRLHEADLGDEGAVAAAARAAGADWVFHLAAHGAYSFETDIREMVRTNVAGTVNLLEAVRATGFEAFVNAGSSSEYGLQDHPPAEDERPEPNSDYAATKLAATQLCRQVARRERLHVVTLRLYSVYGPYEDPRRLLPSLIEKGLGGTLPPLVRSSVARDFVYVDDVCDAFVRAAEGPATDAGEIYNVGTGVQTTLGQAVEVARRLLPIRDEPRWASMTDRSWDTDCWVADARKIRRALGWEPRHRFEQGFARMVEWSKAARSRGDASEPAAG